jgi:hypothetical protein
MASREPTACGARRSDRPKCRLASRKPQPRAPPVTLSPLNRFICPSILLCLPRLTSLSCRQSKQPLGDCTTSHLIDPWAEKHPSLLGQWLTGWPGACLSGSGDTAGPSWPGWMRRPTRPVSILTLDRQSDLRLKLVSNALGSITDNRTRFVHSSGKQTCRSARPAS